MLMDFLRDKMKLIIYIVVIAFVGGGTLVYLNYGNMGGTNQSQANAQNNSPIATVNGAEISNRQFQSQVNQTLNRMRGRVQESQVLSLKKRVLDQLIDRQLIEEEMENRGLMDEVSDEKVEARLDKIVQDSQFNTREELKQRLEQAGRSLDQIRNQLKQSLAMQKLFDEVLKDIEVTDQEVKDNYEEVSASHILIKTENKSNQEAKDKAQEAIEELESGTEFSKVAQEYSEGPSAKRGGKLGSFGRGKMTAAFEDEAFKLDVGEISAPVKTKYGYHVIKVTDKKTAEGEEFESKKSEIKNKLLNKKKKAAFDKWISNKRDEAEIVINSQEIKGYNAQQNENYEEAVMNYNQALEDNSQASYLYNNLAQAYQQQDKTDQAISTYQEAIEKYPEKASFYSALASLYQKQDQTDKAINLYQEALNKNKDNANLHLALGELYRKEEMQDKAIAQYDKFSKLSGDNLMAHYRLYSVYKKMGLTEKANAEMKKVKEIQKKKQQQQQSKKQSIEQQPQQNNGQGTN